MFNENDVTGIYYPIERILANPSVFSFIGTYLEYVPDETIANCFYDLLEICIDEDREPGYMAFFSVEGEEGELFSLVFDSGVSLKMEKRDGNSIFTSQEEVGASFEVNSWLVSLLRKELPEEWRDDFGLVDVPLPENNFLLDPAKDVFAGTVHKLSDPDKKLAFELSVIGDGEYDIKVREV